MRKMANLNYNLLATPYVGFELTRPVIVNGTPNGNISKEINSLEYFATIENLGTVPFHYYCIWSSEIDSNPRTQITFLPPGKARDTYGRFKTLVPVNFEMIKKQRISVEVKYWTQDSVQNMSTYKTTFVYDPARQVFEFLEDEYFSDDSIN